MRRKLLACLTAALLLAFGTGAAPVPVLEPGNWMYSLEVVSNGKQMPVRTAEDCLDEELKDIGEYFAPVRLIVDVQIQQFDHF